MRKLSFGLLKGGGNLFSRPTGENKKSLLSKIKSIFYQVYTNFFQYPDECWAWYSINKKKALQIANTFKPDFILSSSMPVSSHLLAAHIVGKIGSPWAADFRDLWVADYQVKRTKKMETRILNWQKDILKDVSFTVTVSQPDKQLLKMQSEKDGIVVYNGFEQVNEPVHVKNSKINIVYTGMLYDSLQDVELLFKVLKRVKDLEIYFTYFGISSPLIEMYAKKNDVLDRCNIKGLVTQNEAEIIQSEADLLLFLTYNVSGCISGKLFEYLGASKPILALGPHEKSACSIIDETSCGKWFDNEQNAAEYLELKLNDKIKNGIVDYIPKSARNTYSRKQQNIALSNKIKSFLN